MANGLQKVVGEEASETVRFVQMMDHFFDALNVKNFNTGKQKRKIFQDPYRAADDFRLKVEYTVQYRLHAVSTAIICNCLCISLSVDSLCRDESDMPNYNAFKKGYA